MEIIKKMETSNQVTQPSPNSNYVYPDQMKSVQEVASTVRLLLEIPKSLATLRRVFRGEALYQSEDGSNTWIQTVKPVFIQLDPITRKPIMRKVILPDKSEVMQYLPNDEAIEEILSQLSFMGINQITPLTNLDSNNILDDLKEFECKLAGLLALKQVDWGLDKALMPMTMTKIKTIVQDVRYMCCNGGTMRALSQQVSRIEQVIEGDKNLKKMTPYN